jgi:hypothetical protein
LLSFCSGRGVFFASEALGPGWASFRKAADASAFGAIAATAGLTSDGNAGSTILFGFGSLPADLLSFGSRPGVFFASDALGTGCVSFRTAGDASAFGSNAATAGFTSGCDGGGASLFGFGSNAATAGFTSGCDGGGAILFGFGSLPADLLSFGSRPGVFFASDALGTGCVSFRSAGDASAFGSNAATAGFTSGCDGGGASLFGFGSLPALLVSFCSGWGAFFASDALGTGCVSFRSAGDASAFGSDAATAGLTSDDDGGGAILFGFGALPADLVSSGAGPRGTVGSEAFGPGSAALHSAGDTSAFGSDTATAGLTCDCAERDAAILSATG